MRRAVALGCGVLLLAGCSSTGSGTSVVLDSGQAAVSSEFRIAQQEVADSVARIQVGLGQPAGDPPAGLASLTAERLVLNALIGSYALDNGIELTQTQIEDGVAQLAEANGGQDALNQLALQSGVPVEELEDTVATNLIVTEIGSALNTDGDAAAQVESARAALAEYSRVIDVEVAPRYGTWDDDQLAIVPGSDLTEPAAGQG
jgi:hypothetical protein